MRKQTNSLRRRTLELMDGRASLEDIARKLVAEFPKRSRARRKHGRTPVWLRKNTANRLL
jgi:hypothetical protein